MESKAIIKHLKSDTNFVTFVGSVKQLFAEMEQGNNRQVLRLRYLECLPGR